MIYSSRFLSNFPCLVPLVLTRAPRSWLWFNEERFEYRNNCTFPWDGDYDAPPDLPLNKDATIVKECFDRIMQEADLTYMDDIYSRGLWIRRLARFARDGFRDCGEFERCDKFIQGWNNHIGDLSSIYVEPVYHTLPEDGMHLYVECFDMYLFLSDENLVRDIHKKGR